MEKEPTLSLDEYYRLLTENKWIIFWVTVLVVVAAGWYNARMPSIYRATATLIIDKESANSPITGQKTNYETYLSESLTFNTHFELITSRQVLEQTVINLGLARNNKPQQTGKLEDPNPIRRTLSRYRENLALLLGREKPQPAPVDGLTGLINSLKGMITIENVEDTRLLKIRATHPDPEIAQGVANGLAKAYIEFNIDNRMKSSQDTLTWLTDHLYEIKKKLEDSESEFLAYKQQARLISIEGKQQQIAEKITDTNDAYLQARNKRLELDAILQQLEPFKPSGQNPAQARALIANDVISDLNHRLAQSQVDLSQLNKVYKSKHPKMVQAKTNIEQIRLQLDREIEKELYNLKAERTLLLNKEKVLQETIVDFETEGMETNKRELQHAILSRNVETNQSIYDALLARLKEVDITGNLSASNIRIVESATLPRVPVGPNKKRNLLVAVLMGLFLGVFLGFLRENLDRTLHTEEDVRKYLELTVLAVIPKADKSKEPSYGTPYGRPERKPGHSNDIEK